MVNHIRVAPNRDSSRTESGMESQLSARNRPSNELRRLLPLPTDFRVWEDAEPVRSWLRQNRARLRWNSDAGTYQFADAPKADETIK